MAARFEQLFVAALTDRGKDRKARERDYDRLRQYVLSLADPHALDACVERYLKLFPSHAPDDPRSKQIFLILIERRIAKTKPGDPYAEQVAARLHDTRRPFTAIASRYQTLDPGQRAELDALLQPPKAPLSVLAVLRDAYQKKWGWAAKTAEDLYDFDPKPDAALEQGYRARVATCQRLWDICRAQLDGKTWDAFRASFDDYSDFVTAHHGDTLALWQLLNWTWRPHVRHTVKTPRTQQVHDTPAGYLDEELYLRIVLGLYIRNKNVTLHELTAEEWRFLFDPLAGVFYAADYEARFRFGMTNVPAFHDLTLQHLRLLLTAAAKNVSLAPSDVTAAILSVYEAAGTLAAEEQKDAAALPRKTFRVFSTWDVARGKYGIGDTVGAGAAECRVLYFQGDNRAPDIYVEFTSQPGVIFRMDLNEFTRRVEATVRQIVWRDNAGLADLIEQFVNFTMDWLAPEIGFLDVFLEHGAAAVVIEYAKQKAFDLGLQAVIDTVSLPGALGTLGGLAAVASLATRGKAGRLALVKEAAERFKKNLREALEETEHEASRLTRHELGTLGVHAPETLEHETTERLIDRMADEDRRALARQTDRRLEREAGLSRENPAARVAPSVRQAEQLSRQQQQAIRQVTAEVNARLVREGRLPKGWEMDFPRTPSNEAGLAQVRGVTPKSSAIPHDRDVVFRVPRKVARNLGVAGEVRFDGVRRLPGRAEAYVLQEHKEALAIWERSGFSRPEAFEDLVQMMEHQARFFEELSRAKNSWWKGIVYTGGGDPALQKALDEAVIEARKRLGDPGTILFSGG